MSEPKTFVLSPQPLLDCGLNDRTVARNFTAAAVHRADASAQNAGTARLQQLAVRGEVGWVIPLGEPLLLPEGEAEQWKPDENDHWVKLMRSLVANQDKE
jgi:hypothetical protein